MAESRNENLPDPRAGASDALKIGFAASRYLESLAGLHEGLQRNSLGIQQRPIHVEDDCSVPHGSLYYAAVGPIDPGLAESIMPTCCPVNPQ